MAAVQGAGGDQNVLILRDGKGKGRDTPRSTHKILAAMFGATVTSFTMTPFDVIKTRLQTQETPEPLFSPSSHLRPLPTQPIHSIPSTSKVTLSTTLRPSTNQSGPNPTCCRTTFFTTNLNSNSLICKFDPRILQSAPRPDFNAASSVSSMSMPAATKRNTSLPIRSIPLTVPTNSCAFPNPETAELVLMTDSPPRLSGLVHAFSTILKTEGPKSLWRGVGTTVAISVPSQAMYMVGYDWLRYRMIHNWVPTWAMDRQGQTKQSYQTGSVLLAGSLTRSMIVTIFSPLELIRTRLQIHPHHNTWREIIRTALQDQKTGRKASVLSLWRGLPPTLWRDVPFSAIYWVGYDTLKKSFTGTGMGEGWKNGEMGKQSALQGFTVAFVCGGASGMIAASFTNAFDVVKTRRQALSGTLRYPNGTESKNTFVIVRDILKTEGIAGLQRGLSPRLARVGPACAIMIGSYEGLGGWLEERLK